MIISSTYEISQPQADNRVWVSEVHVDDQKQEWLFFYLADDSKNAQTVMEERALAIEEQQKNDAVAEQQKLADQKEIAAVLFDAVDQGKLKPELAQAILPDYKELKP